MISLLLGVLGSIIILAVVGGVIAAVLDAVGFFNPTSFECKKCGQFFHDYRWLAKADGESFCLSCCKPGPHHDRSHFFGRCAECKGEFPLAAMIGINEDITCEPCWRNRLWPKDWRAKFKANQSPPAQPPANQ